MRLHIIGGLQTNKARDAVRLADVIEVVDRPRLDAVAVLLYRNAGGGGRELLLRMNLRPAAYFRREKRPVVPDEREFLQVEEIVAGLLEGFARQLINNTAGRLIVGTFMLVFWTGYFFIWRGNAKTETGA
jgi:hypothetical protein